MIFTKTKHKSFLIQVGLAILNIGIVIIHIIRHNKFEHKYHKYYFSSYLHISDILSAYCLGVTLYKVSVSVHSVYPSVKKSCPHSSLQSPVCLVVLSQPVCALLSRHQEHNKVIKFEQEFIHLV